MAQTFMTTYKKNYRWNYAPPRKPIFPTDKFAETPPEGEMWQRPVTVGVGEEESMNLRREKAAVRKLYTRRLRSTYQVHYCREMVDKLNKELEFRADEENTIDREEPVDNELLEYFKKLYSPKTQKIPLPLPTSRRLYGYMRPSRVYVPLTTYQINHGRIAFDILNNNNKATIQPVLEGNTPVDNEPREHSIKIPLPPLEIAANDSENTDDDKTDIKYIEKILQKVSNTHNGTPLQRMDIRDIDLLLQNVAVNNCKCGNKTEDVEHILRKLYLMSAPKRCNFCDCPTWKHLVDRK